MGVIRSNRRSTAAAGLLATAVLLLAACGDSPCNHVIQDVPRFEDCQAIAVERGCSFEVTYSRANMRCKVENCNDCSGPRPTPTALPGS